MNQNNNVIKKKIQTLLRKALLKNGLMEYALFEYELKEHINYWYKGLKADRDEFVFIVTENSGHVASNSHFEINRVLTPILKFPK
jgi:hypothetical protein